MFIKTKEKMKITFNIESKDVVAELDENDEYEFSRWNAVTRLCGHSYSRAICEFSENYLQNIDKPSVAILGVAAGGMLVQLNDSVNNIELVGVDNNKECINFCKSIKNTFFPNSSFFCEDGLKWAENNKKKFSIIINDMFLDVKGIEASKALTGRLFFRYCFSQCSIFIQHVILPFDSTILINEAKKANGSLKTQNVNSSHQLIIFSKNSTFP